MTNTSYQILKFLQENNGATALEVAEALDLEKRRVDSYFSAGIMREGLGSREKKDDVIRLVLNNKGLQYN